MIHEAHNYWANQTEAKAAMQEEDYAPKPEDWMVNLPKPNYDMPENAAACRNIARTTGYGSVSTQGASDGLAWSEGRSTVNPKPLDWDKLPQVSKEDIKQMLDEPDNEQQVVKPAHYNGTGITALQVIDDWQLNFRIGNAVKYLARYLKKGSAIDDLKKASEYIALEITRLQNLSDDQRRDKQADSQ